MKVRVHSVFYRLFAVTVLFVVGMGALPAAGQISVTSATPNNTAQGTVSLDVTISGKGFKSGAKAQWFISGTTNPGGVVVNSTAFVNSNTLTANITVSDTAFIGNFDVIVDNSDGRTGKGSELFAVTAKTSASSVSCGNGPALGWSQVSALNSGQYTAGGLGVSVRVRLLTLTDPTTLTQVQYYVGMAGSGSGQLMVLFTMDLSGAITSSTVVANTYSARSLAVGDIDGDGAPDWVIGFPAQNSAHILFGQITNGTQYSIDPTRSVTIPAPASHNKFGQAVAIGDLDGDGKDEVVVTDPGGGSGKNTVAGAAYVYRFNDNSASTTWTNYIRFGDPSGKTGTLFGYGAAVAQVTQTSIGGVPTPVRDLIVGASNSGTAWILQDPLHTLGTSLPSYSIAGIGSNTLGALVAAGDVNGDGNPDVVVINSTQALVFAGPIAGNNPAVLYTLLPRSGLDAGWGTSSDVVDIDGDGHADVLVGAPNAAESSACQNSPGAVYLYFGSGLVPGTNSASGIFELSPSQLEGDFMGFGYGVAGAPSQGIGLPSIFAVGENGANVAGTAGAGQVYTFKK